MSQVVASRRRPTRFVVILALVAVGAAVLRVAYLIAFRDNFPQPDGVYYQWAAALLRDGRGFVNPFSGEPSAFHPPLWTVVLAIPPFLGRSSQLSAQLFASFVGVLTVTTVGFAGRRVSSDRVGLIAAGLAAAYPGLWGYERALLSETLVFLGIALLIVAAYRYLAAPGRWRAVQLGGLCGLLALTRSEQIFLVAVLLFPLILGWHWRGFTRRRFESLILACITTAVVIAPWTIYNLNRFDKPIFLSDSFGSAMAQGNCNSTYYGERLGYYDFKCLKSTAIRASRHGVKDALSDSALRKEAITYLLDHVERLPVVLAGREGRTWSVYKPFGTQDLEYVFPQGEWWPKALNLFFFWALLPLAVIGGVVLKRRRVPLLPLVAPLVVTVVTVAVTYGQPRLRAGAEVPLVLLAAVGVEQLVRRAAREASVDDDSAPMPAGVGPV
jgi:4-amino-4-deoxy-L-arabinose transferase-like glycosyltransferase